MKMLTVAAFLNILSHFAQPQMHIALYATGGRHMLAAIIALASSPKSRASWERFLVAQQHVGMIGAALVFCSRDWMGMKPKESTRQTWPRPRPINAFLCIERRKRGCGVKAIGEANNDLGDLARASGLCFSLGLTKHGTKDFLD